jgi:hypothetical protein
MLAKYFEDVLGVSHLIVDRSKFPTRTVAENSGSAMVADVVGNWSGASDPSFVVVHYSQFGILSQDKKANELWVKMMGAIEIDTNRVALFEPVDRDQLSVVLQNVQSKFEAVPVLVFGEFDYQVGMHKIHEVGVPVLDSPFSLLINPHLKKRTWTVMKQFRSEFGK